jgi:hypothetical protein
MLRGFSRRILHITSLAMKVTGTEKDVAHLQIRRATDIRVALVPAWWPSVVFLCTTNDILCAGTKCFRPCRVFLRLLRLSPAYSFPFLLCQSVLVALLSIHSRFFDLMMQNIVSLMAKDSPTCCWDSQAKMLGSNRSSRVYWVWSAT